MEFGSGAAVAVLRFAEDDGALLAHKPILHALHPQLVLEISSFLGLLDLGATKVIGRRFSGGENERR